MIELQKNSNFQKYKKEDVINFNVKKKSGENFVGV